MELESLNVGTRTLPHNCSLSDRISASYINQLEYWHWEQYENVNQVTDEQFVPTFMGKSTRITMFLTTLNRVIVLRWKSIPMPNYNYTATKPSFPSRPVPVEFAKQRQVIHADLLQLTRSNNRLFYHTVQ